MTSLVDPEAKILRTACGRDAGRFTPPKPSAPASNGAMAEAFAKAKRGG